MGLRDAIKNAAQAAIAATGDVAETVNYDAMGSATYDVSAGTPGGEGFRYVTTMIFSKTVNETFGQSVALMGIVSQNDLPIHPATKDEVTRIVDEASTVYELVDFKEDPAGAIWMMGFNKK